MNKSRGAGNDEVSNRRRAHARLINERYTAVMRAGEEKYSPEIERARFADGASERGRNNKKNSRMLMKQKFPFAARENGRANSGVCFSSV